MTKLLIQLRKATKSLHDTIEKTTPLTKIMQTPLHKDSYIQALNYLYPPIFQLESSLDKFMPEFNYQARHPLLALDLKNLGTHPPKIKNLSHLQLSCEIQKYGHFYVLVGSQLGGHIIANHINQHANNLSTLFFDSSDKQVWKQLINTINQATFNQEQEAQIIKAATTAFELFLPSKDI
ncbi:Heme oxygenase [Allopseudospirillum japonicum]|uniref:Heme oxygenase n=1 Tax=Allopseudospirillum japonicum TaxID=64971 RepID=A0A1H6Q056_9GAMM|nr:biliverdin-producing heme oxygenase [Allopseudospirillum japonicum]SEI37238.1 Heme oxygenase [Allopseudospirillum japonicum]